VTGGAILKILDSWDWTDEAMHINALRGKKFKNYPRFIETGELLDVLPQVAGKPVVIEVVGRFLLTDAAMTFLEAVFLPSPQT
jgi:hypothetical protein